LWLDEKIKEVQQEVATIPYPSWSIEWARLSFAMEHPKVPLTPIYLEVKEEVGQQILDNKITITIGQLLKLTPNLNTYLITISKQVFPKI
jgi:hypothetical protein